MLLLALEIWITFLLHQSEIDFSKKPAENPERLSQAVLDFLVDTVALKAVVEISNFT
jgi:hypothetical protein